MQIDHHPEPRGPQRRHVVADVIDSVMRIDMSVSLAALNPKRKKNALPDPDPDPVGSYTSPRGRPMIFSPIGRGSGEVTTTSRATTISRAGAGLITGGGGRASPAGCGAADACLVGGATDGGVPAVSGACGGRGVEVCCPWGDTCWPCCGVGCWPCGCGAGRA
jgi:hypothetical protein